MQDNTHRLVIRVNQQQRELLERLRDEGEFGDTLAEVVSGVFRRFADDVASREGKR
ncbi:MAG: hypothetical protein OXI22_00590 [Defluviicoccus sp.]|nr:hypothetical protein [Defluviicoccus sp.]MDE0382354.1 hypothetical protein [Defluviicoccus sp.]